MNTAVQGLADMASDQQPPGANEHQAWLQLGDLGEHSVYDYQGTERINGCYQAQITIVCSAPLQELSALLQAPATLVLKSPKGFERYVHGVVLAIAELDRSVRHVRYLLTLVPPLALLELRRGVRIFQALSVPDIVEQLLTEAGLSPDTRSWRLGGDYEPREYCVQYNETELGFIERILAEAGIHYHFAHDQDGAYLILADGPEGLDTLPALPFNAENGMAGATHAIHRFSVGPTVRSASVSLSDYDFTRPDLLLRPQSVSLPTADDVDEQVLEDYAWPGAFTTQAQGRQLTDLSLARHRHQREQANGNSDSPQLMAGHYQPLSEHPEPAYNQSWLITQLTYQGKQPQVLGELADGQSTYSNSFLAQPWTSPYKPPSHPKPQVPGQQSAIVTGPAGEEIYCDEYGRVKVQFYWDRLAQADEKTSTWLRVSQGWAGNGYGLFVLPRVGMEVLVSFINGDPDRPIITGCLFNGHNQVPYALPKHKTRSTFKTASSPGGGNSNELRFEDKADHEEIYLHASKDYQEHISHNSHSHINNDREQLIEGQHINEVRGELHHTVHGTSHWHAKADEHHVIDGSRHTLVANKELVSAGQEIHLSTGQKIILEAGAELTFKAGGSYLKLDPSGVTLVGPTIDLNAGGSASKGTIQRAVKPARYAPNHVRAPLVLSYNKAHPTEVPPYDINDPMSSGALQPVTILPIEWAIEGIADAASAIGEMLDSGPSLAGAATAAIALIPGKIADKLIEPVTNKMGSLASATASTAVQGTKKATRAMGLHKVACFKKNSKGSTVEYDRQLKGQQDGINNMTTKEYLDNRESYKDIGRKGTGAAQKKAREDFKKDLVKRHIRELRESKGLRGEELTKQAELLASNDMKTLNALHNPDMIAGGYDNVVDLGDASVNQSIGTQWKNTGVNERSEKYSLSRVEAMDVQAKAALKQHGPNAKMNVDLHRCK